MSLSDYADGHLHIKGPDTLELSAHIYCPILYQFISFSVRHCSSCSQKVAASSGTSRRFISMWLGEVDRII